jgi:hypothetical protein
MPRKGAVSRITSRLPPWTSSVCLLRGAGSRLLFSEEQPCAFGVTALRASSQTRPRGPGADASATVEATDLGYSGEAVPGGPTVGHGASRRFGLSSPHGAGVRAAAARQLFRATGPRVRAPRAPDRLLPMAMTFALDGADNSPGRPRVVAREPGPRTTAHAWPRSPWPVSPHARLWLRRLYGRLRRARERIIDLGRAPYEVRWPGRP